MAGTPRTSAPGFESVRVAIPLLFSAAVWLPAVTRPLVTAAPVAVSVTVARTTACVALALVAVRVRFVSRTVCWSDRIG